MLLKVAISEWSLRAHLIFVRCPVQRVTETTNKVNVTDRMWARLLSSTQQPSFLEVNKEFRHGKKEGEEAIVLPEKKKKDESTNSNGAVGDGAPPTIPLQEKEMKKDFILGKVNISHNLMGREDGDGVVHLEP